MIKTVSGNEMRRERGRIRAKDQVYKCVYAVYTYVYTYI